MKVRNEILECKEGDRFIFIQYDKNETVEWLNFHQGLDEVDMNFNKPCEKLTTIYKTLTLGEDNECREEFKQMLTQAIDLYFEVVVLPTEEGDVLSNRKLEVYKSIVKFFQDLIHTTQTYFLSDYVVTELPEHIEGKELEEFMLRFEALKQQCTEFGLDVHEISQEVATPFMMGVELGERVCPKCGTKIN